MVIVIGRWKSDKQSRHIHERCMYWQFQTQIFSAILHVLFRATNSLFENIRK